MPFTLYATGEDGKGYVQQIGVFDDIEDIIIRVGLFDKDTIITIHEHSS